MHRLILLVLAASAASLAPSRPAAAADGAALRRLERSYWLHASLADDTRRGYWGSAFPAAAPASDEEIGRAARLLARHYGASRLYLVYHGEVPVQEAERLLTAWRRACPRGVEIVPTLVLRMYDTACTETFAAEDRRLTLSFMAKANRRRIAVYDVYPRREQGAGLAEMAARFPSGLLRVGLQPGEALAAPFVGAVEDTWSAFCQGKTDADWRSPGFGRDTLLGWVRERNQGAARIAWDLIAVAWDYAATQRGEYPGYDDANRNMPLPARRNRQAVRDILAAADPSRLAGFSSDLFIVQANSASAPHDGPAGALYRALRSGQPYAGYYAGPLEEIAAVYRDLAAGRAP